MSAGVPALTALWAFGEAFVFFIVPDVILTRQCLLGRRTEWRLLALALAGALLGAIMSFALCRWVGEAYTELLAHIPAISDDMVVRAQEAIADGGLRAVLAGSFQGMPYKLFSHGAYHQGVPLWLFLLWSVPGRGVRFLLVSVVAATIGRGMQSASRRTLVLLHVVLWLAFYAAYFATFRG